MKRAHIESIIAGDVAVGESDYATIHSNTTTLCKRQQDPLSQELSCMGVIWGAMREREEWF